MIRKYATILTLSVSAVLFLTVARTKEPRGGVYSRNRPNHQPVGHLIVGWRHADFECCR